MSANLSDNWIIDKQSQGGRTWCNWGLAIQRRSERGYSACQFLYNPSLQKKKNLEILFSQLRNIKVLSVQEFTAIHSRIRCLIKWRIPQRNPKCPQSRGCTLSKSVNVCTNANVSVNEKRNLACSTPYANASAHFQLQSTIDDLVSTILNVNVSSRELRRPSLIWLFSVVLTKRPKVLHNYYKL